VVSLNQCLDAVLLQVADRSQIAALTYRSRDPEVSIVADQARSFPFTRETAEEVVALRPDLVIAGRRSALQTRLTLKRLGIRVEEFSVPESVAASLAQVRRIAGLVGQAGRGEALIARIQAALARAAPPKGSPTLPAIIYQSRGLVAGRDTLVSEMMARCGLENVAARYGLRKWGSVPLERLVADPPQVLLVGEPPPGTPSWADRIVLHPVLSRLEPRMHRVPFPPRLLYCGGPTLIESAAVLADARRQTLGFITAQG
jgi:iron complex transport system substrate-binding protein